MALFNPYVGPRPFEREDSRRFFGRDQETAELLSLIVAHRVVVLYAPSGAGKTSLLNATIIPGLEARGFELFPSTRVFGVVQTDISQINPYALFALTGWAGDEASQDELAGLTIAQYLAEQEPLEDEYGRPAPRVLIFDQFEELFTAFPARWSERAAFFDQVNDALAADPLLRVVFSLREDYIAQLDPYVHQFPRRLRHRFRLERMQPEPALVAITGPLRVTTRQFAPNVAEQLVVDLLQTKQETAEGVTTAVGQFIEPVQLQVVCQNLWRTLPDDVATITQAEVETYGDVTQALMRFYEDSVKQAASAAPVTEDALRTWFEETLITPAGTRGLVFQDREKEETGGIPNSAVKELDDFHIIRGEIRSGSRWYELTHDRFIDPILKSNEAWRNKQKFQLELERQRRELELQSQQRRAIYGTIGIMAFIILFVIFNSFFQSNQAQTAVAEAADQVTVAAEQAVAVSNQSTAVAIATLISIDQTATAVAATAVAQATADAIQAESFAVLATVVSETTFETDPDVYAATTQSLFGSFDADERLERLATLLNFESQPGDQYDEIAVTLFNNLSPEDQTALFTDLTNPAEEIEQIETVIQALRVTAEPFYQTNDTLLLDAMLSALSEATGESPSSIQFELDYWQEARQEISDEDYETAVTYYDAALEENPNNPFLYYDRALAYDQISEYEIALADLENAAELSPSLNFSEIVRHLTDTIQTKMQTAGSDDCDTNFFRAWPTDYRSINQYFGANPQSFAQYGLPGHQGIDIMSPLGENVYAVAGGTVYRVDANPAGSIYGIAIRLVHTICDQTYRTLYTHLQEALVEEGQTVSAGELIAYSNNTGDSFGSHLHLELRLDGAEVGGYPNGIIDPAPFLLPLLGETAEEEEPAPDEEITGWVHADFIEIRNWTSSSGGSEFQWQDAIVLTLLNIRSDPEFGAEVIGTVNYGTRLTITGESEWPWYPIRVSASKVTQ
ncbi:MAG: peptidoglycan DD-metalloendopeptidase family protein [Chloroflexi bacterium]|nr:peptidoglycan DD-metalloendopeptidase family protein [Chloroflexota bacterium]